MNLSGVTNRVLGYASDPCVMKVLIYRQLMVLVCTSNAGQVINVAQ